MGFLEQGTSGTQPRKVLGTSGLGNLPVTILLWCALLVLLRCMTAALTTTAVCSHNLELHGVSISVLRSLHFSFRMYIEHRLTSKVSLCRQSGVFTQNAIFPMTNATTSFCFFSSILTICPPKRRLVLQTFLAEEDVQKEALMLTEYSLRVGECRQTVDNECLCLLLFLSVHYRRPYAEGSAPVLVFMLIPPKGTNHH